MANIPDPQRLDLTQFPKESWAKALVAAFNQLSTQISQITQVKAPVYKTLKFTTKAAVANSFPIDFPVPGPLSSIRVAQVIRGGTLAGSAISVQWTMLSQARGASGFSARVTLITGLSLSTAYEIKLALE